jgi:hypothetical protein
MNGLDKFQQIAAKAEYTVVILSNLDTNDTQFVELQAEIPADLRRVFSERGLAWIGCIGLVNGQPRVALDVELDSENIAAITRAFVAYARRHARWTAQPDMNAN